MQPKEFLMIPGPTPVPERILEAVARHPLGHRTADFSKILHEVAAGLKWLGQTENDVFVLTASGTGAMESAIANTVSPGDHVLSLSCGVFGERWAKLAEAYGAQVERLQAAHGQAIDVEAVARKLETEKSKKYKVVTVTHNETSTGVINDLKEIAKVIRSHGALSLVDAVTSFGACPVPIDEWDLDIVVTGSQKALMLPPGLGVVFVSKRAWEVQAQCTTPRFYFDFKRYRKSMDDNTTPFTPNVSFVVALAESLKMFREDGLDKVFARHKRLKTMLRAGIAELGLEPFVDESCASPTITAILPPAQVTVDAIRKGMRERFRILTADGQDALKGSIFRIGHMGYVFERDILMTIACLEAVLTDLGHKSPPAKAVGAAAGAKPTSKS